MALDSGCHTGTLYKRALTVLPSAVMPHLSNPLLLSDFLTRSIELGGLLGVLALNGLFVRVTQYGLEYPQFYARLYNLLTVRI
jgi:U3 small nucleolar RNA-associated protein 19